MNTSRSLYPSLLAVTVGGMAAASAVVTYVENVNVAIPANFGGVYLDITGNATNSSSPSGAAGNDAFTISYSEPAVGGWDFNFFFGGVGIAHNSTVNPYRDDATDNLSAIHALGIDDLIDGSTATPSGAVPLATPSFGGSGTGSGGGSGVSTSGDHMGAALEQFQAGQQEYIGFVLDPGTASESYGWILVTFNDDGSDGIIHEFAFSDTPLNVGAVPEPSTGILGLIGMMMLFRRKRF